MVNNNLYKFIKTGQYSDIDLNSFINENNITKSQLLIESFNYLYDYVTIKEISNYSIFTINNTVDLIIKLFSIIEIDDKDIDTYKYRIQKANDKLKTFFNYYGIEDDFDVVNKLNSIILIKKNLENKLIVLLEELIDRKENINIIKKIICSNTNVISHNNFYLFDYIFNLSIDKIKNSSSDANYYLALLKMTYSPKINKKKYLSYIEDCENSLYIRDLYSILSGSKKILNAGEILDKYGITQKYIFFQPNFNNNLSTQDTIITIDNNKASLREDAFSIKKDGSKYIIGIYICDAGKYVLYNSRPDIIARKNFKTLYLLDGTHINLFSNSVQKNFSFDENETKPAICLKAIMNDSGEILDYYIEENDIIITKNFNITGCENALDGKTNTGFERSISELSSLAYALKEKNISSNHIRYKNIEETRSDVLIRELMILYNTLVAKIAQDNSIDFIYKTQNDEYISELATSVGIDIESYGNLFKNIYLDSKYTLEPKPHCRLDTLVYSDSSRPFRKYPALFNQYLLHAQYFNDINIKLNENTLEYYLEYFNQREEDLSLLKLEYNGKTRILSKKH